MNEMTVKLIISHSGSGSDVQSVGAPQTTNRGVGFRSSFTASAASSPRQREREWSTGSSSCSRQGASAGLGKESALPAAAADQIGDPAGLGCGSPTRWGDAG